MCNNLEMIYCILTKSLDERQYDYDKNDEMRSKCNSGKWFENPVRQTSTQLNF